MLIGIISDTHDCLSLIDVAVKQLNKERVKLVLHAGDFIAPFVAAHLKPLKAELIGVFGNNDGDKEVLPKKFAEIGAEIRGDFAEIIVDGLKFALLHGHSAELLRSLVNSGGYHVVVHGHTHQANVYRRSATLVINPGEACGYLSGKATIAIFDTENHEVRILQLNRKPNLHKIQMPRGR